MNWARKHTHIPVPGIVRYDATENNLIGHEFTLLERAPGVSVDQIYDKLSMETKTNMVRQLTDYLIELYLHPWKDGYVGGLTLHGNGESVCGPPIDEFFWQVPDLEKYWPSPEMHEILDMINPIPVEGFTSYVAFNVGCLERYIHAINVHPLLEPYRDTVPRLQSLIVTLEQPAFKDQLNRVVYVFAHKDLHLGNIISEDKAEQTQMEELFEKVCLEKGPGWMLEEMKMNELQESMQNVVNQIREIVEVCAKGQANDRVARWRSVAETSMERFGV
ncbi:hypothetical protein PMAA_090420 [Talaromyces marneffei ATCC 18224]|uniref:Aminoglycoside phosphotransferase domain-containing protein n=1 Tax=Talaromyces marneffei (strain ATCC 18224 / CBS 334.59 / QM 7333) TaxID=441960 RepID=B6QJ97_TALMQ|nr:hypothetical protein PMAA_090420 [Talaromyces marneffei ATCC 18224]